MSDNNNLILTNHQVRQIIRRIAFEIYENNFDEKQLVIVGVHEKGYLLAQQIVEVLQQIAVEKKITLVKLLVNKEAPIADDISLDCPSEKLKNRTVVLVDDVLNTGRTLAHSLKVLLGVEVKKLEVAVLVDRSHKLFPITATYKGYELSTTIDEHVDVQIDQGVFLR